MPIQFTCRRCGQALFAQEQYAGRLVKCPACQDENSIPAPRDCPVLPQAGSGPQRDDELIDMEQAPEPLPAVAAPPPETSAGDALLNKAERSAYTWRVLAMLFTIVTAGWLVLLTLETFQKAPATLAIFNLLLAGGLVWNATQMRRGPASVFGAVALAVLFCMPIDTILGLALVDEATMEKLRSQNPQYYASLTADSVNGSFGLMFSIVGLFFSIPLWIAGRKVMAFQRLRSSQEKEKER